MIFGLSNQKNRDWIFSAEEQIWGGGGAGGGLVLET